MASDFLKFLAIFSVIIVVGIVLAIIGIQHEHLTKLRDEKADRDKKIEELETELSKYDRKRRKEKK